MTSTGTFDKPLLLTKIILLDLNLVVVEAMLLLPVIVVAEVVVVVVVVVAFGSSTEFLLASRSECM